MDHFIQQISAKRILIYLLVLFISSTGWSQTTSVKGSVRDAASKLPVPFASVYIKGGGGVVADSMGRFQLATDQNIDGLQVSYVGYNPQTISIQKGKSQTITIELNPDASKDLSAIVIKSKNKIKYSNKNNPAVELIRKVIDNKNKNKPENYSYVEYEGYEKIQLSLSRPSEDLANSKLLKKYNFLLQGTDTTKVKGKALTPIYLEEKLSSNYFSKDPNKSKKIVEGERRVNFGDFIDSAGVSSFLKRLYQDINVYDNSISLFTNQFLSPIADGAPTYYKFYIRDTITDASGTQLVKLYFTPRNTNDFLFRGTLYVTLDHYAVQQLDMTISPNINLNLVRDMHIHQGFEKNPADGRYHLIKTDITTDLGITKGKSNGIYGERSVSYKNYTINQPHEQAFYAGPSTSVVINPAQYTDSFWIARRHDSLSIADAKVYQNMDSLKNTRSYKRFTDVATILLAGYKSFDKFEIGPASTFYSWNPVEGFRLRFGGRTTPNLSKRFYFETYGAYGFKDEKWKGFFSFTYSLNNKSIYAFPVNYVRASAQRETKIPGQELQFVQEDNLLLSIKRGKNDKWLYNDIYRVDFVKEFADHLSYAIGFKNWKQTPAGSISYTTGKEPPFIPIPDLTTSELSAQIRWAPNEQFYQGKIYRIPIINKYPVFTFQYTRGIKGLIGGEYNYNKFNLSVQKRAYLSQFGYTDMILEGAYITGQLPYPLLSIHRANQTYAYQLYSYNLMNFLEFVSDHYVSLNVDHHFNGFIFNRLPLINKLNLREIVSAKVIYGAVRGENDPAKNETLYNYPVNENGLTTTFSLNDGPYVEGSVGIGNIFKLLRLDLVKRFTYLYNPDVAEWGIRARMRFDF